MSTRSRIGILNADGSVDSIYCHHDGYLSHVGDLLINCYDTEEKVRELLKLCDISSLEGTIKQTQKFAYNSNGEDTEVLHSKNESEFLKVGEEYNYLFKNGKWHVYGYDFNDEEVTPELIEKDE